jgi:hypothetical protein
MTRPPNRFYGKRRKQSLAAVRLFLLASSLPKAMIVRVGTSGRDPRYAFQIEAFESAGDQ